MDDTTKLALAVVFAAGSLFFGVGVIRSSSSAPAKLPLTTQPVMPAPAEPPARTDATRAAARAAYLHDRDAVRKAKPKTEDDVTKVIGRPPDDVIETPESKPPSTILMWYYDDKPDGRDVLGVTTQNGRIVVMNL